MSDYNLKICAYDKPDGNLRTGELDSFTVDFNPNTFAVNHKVEYKQAEGKGQGGTDPTFEKIPAMEFSLEFTIDGTGVALANLPPGKKEEFNNQKQDYVKSQVKTLREVAGININGDIHRPNYLSVTWGSFYINCVMTALNITYNLFDQQGVPLRAKINCSFLQRFRPGENERQSSLESADLTKYKLIKEGDILPLIAKENYEDSAYYLQLAKVNKLKNFRNIPPGTTLVLPPMAETDE